MNLRNSTDTIAFLRFLLSLFFFCCKQDLNLSGRLLSKYIDGERRILADQRYDMFSQELEEALRYFHGLRQKIPLRPSIRKDIQHFDKFRKGMEKELCKVHRIFCAVIFNFCLFFPVVCLLIC